MFHGLQKMNPPNLSDRLSFTSRATMTLTCVCVCVAHEDEALFAITTS